MLNIGWDTETHLIAAPDSIIPPIVCGSWDVASEGSQSTEWRDVASTGDADLWSHTLRMWQSAYQQDGRIIVHNSSFDVCVALRYCLDVRSGHKPGDKDRATDLYLLIWDVLEKSMDNEWSASGPVLVSDTLLREKLLNLSTLGSMTVGPKGGNLRYGLDSLVLKYLRVDISSGKVHADSQGRIFDQDGNDITGTPKAGAAWRLRYRELDGVPTAQWPMEAWTYAWDDAYYARLVWEAQEKRVRRGPKATHSTVNSESLQVYSSIALYITTATGFEVDRQQASRVVASIATHLDAIEGPLRDNGIIRSNGSVNKKVVKSRVEYWWDWLGRQPLLTDTGDIATDKEVMEILCSLDPILQVYAERQGLAKLRDAFMPSLGEGKVYTNFDPIKETGRTSSFGASEKKGRKPLYAAINSQQMPRKEGVRECLLPPPPDPGAAARGVERMLINSSDYGALELCSVAQMTYMLFKRSVHRDKINAGYDLHTYLGSAIAMLKEPDLVGRQSDLDTAYQVLNAQRKYRPPPGYFDPETGKPYRADSEVEDRLELGKRSKHFRNLAKPVGLGYPGGLGEDTLTVFAKTVYKVDISPSEAAELKDLWFHVYPEMVDFFAYVRKSKDRASKDDEGDFKYCYVTPGFNRFRAGATYCATANGLAMLSLSADGAKRAMCWAARACSGGVDPSNPYRILEDCSLLSFIHDELLVAIPDDPLATERSVAITALMEQSMQIHMPDVRITAEPALMRRWRKGAEAEWVDDSSGDRNRATTLATQLYGPELGTQMMEQFAPPSGKRLVAHEAIRGEAVKEIA